MAAAATPGLWDWSVDPQLVLIVVAGALYALGNRHTLTPAGRRDAQRMRAVCFYAALAVLAIALASPLDAISEQLFWAHMVQHVLLMLVAAPLLVMARPWIRIWRALPRDARRSLAWAPGRAPAWAPLRALARWLGRPVPALVLFCTTLLAWHVPPLFDATLRSEPVHALEHTMFFLAALLFWKNVIDSPPLRAPLTPPQRIGYTIVATVASWLLALVLAVAPEPLYAHYAHELSRPGGISALADQQLAAGIMWVPGSVAFVLVLFVHVHRWLAPAPQPPARRLAGEH
jgi:cytochrome c oxidase assembly factor CtaG